MPFSRKYAKTYDISNLTKAILIANAEINTSNLMGSCYIGSFTDMKLVPLTLLFIIQTTLIIRMRKSSSIIPT